MSMHGYSLVPRARKGIWAQDEHGYYACVCIMPVLAFSTHVLGSTALEIELNIFLHNPFLVASLQVYCTKLQPL